MSTRYQLRSWICLLAQRICVYCANCPRSKGFNRTNTPAWYLNVSYGKQGHVDHNVCQQFLNWSPLLITSTQQQSFSGLHNFEKIFNCDYLGWNCDLVWDMRGASYFYILILIFIKKDIKMITVPLLQGSLPNKDVFLHLNSMMCDSCQPPGTQAGAAGSSALLNESLHKARPMWDEQLRLAHLVFGKMETALNGELPDHFHEENEFVKWMGLVYPLDSVCPWE